MPEEEANFITPEQQPEPKDATFESPKETGQESKEQHEQSEQGEGDEQDGNDTPEPVQVKMPAAPAAPSAVPIEKDPILTDIESILQDDLTDLFLSLPDDKKWEFKQKGEETASKIREMVAGGKFKIKKIFQLIRDWLKIVPGVNKYFLEQEAKIKADKLLKYAQEQAKASQNKL
ncbi:hypothetical protein HON52_01050 [Candidatus Uhrbacteria bacterium]|jgi:hypothetical protein|nr:hypothetical protein [Candidatus Uhrbacteria bacterium]